MGFSVEQPAAPESPAGFTAEQPEAPDEPRQTKRRGRPLGSKSKNPRKGQKVFSLFLDKELLEHIQTRGLRHRRGRSGYVRELIEQDLRNWKGLESVRNQAILKLSPAEREALGVSLDETTSEE